MGKHIYHLAEASEPQLVGGKAFALGKMIQAGFTVPNGFVLSAATFLKMTPALENDLLQAFDQLQTDVVAVRSSALSEDGAEDAWAGQLDTFLNCTRSTLLEHVQKCWQSAGSARAKAYAAQKALRSTKVAVIVQAMIPSEISGVTFSVHPVTNDEGQMVIEAGLGLGEAIVSGEITPDTYIVDKHSGRCLEKHRAQQSKKLVRNHAGETAWEEIGAAGQEQKLSDAQISQLCSLTAKLADFFGYPVDVEWAISKGVLYVLQCRPITTLAG